MTSCKAFQCYEVLCIHYIDAICTFAIKFKKSNSLFTNNKIYEMIVKKISNMSYSTRSHQSIICNFRLPISFFQIFNEFFGFIMPRIGCFDNVIQSIE